MELILLQWWSPEVRPDHSQDEYWDQMIHPEDLNFVSKEKFNTSIFLHLNNDGEYLVLSDLKNEFRVKPICTRKVKYEGFSLNDNVETIPNEGKNTKREGRIISMFYHYKDECIIYQISDQTGNILKKQYRKSDLKKTNANKG
ncbi:hypothetical protein [Flagellimonas beolgyonensis]|uniref:hypothetical protein n=1 Tax=Flagellimonas beolgyonensis TaxID=864064 RepID=UPI000F8CA01F|nr:hypothetical protein [Allomuricauda beolgyonensis]